MEEVMAVHIRHSEEMSNNNKIQLHDKQFVYWVLCYVSLCFEKGEKLYQMMVSVEE